MESYPNGNSWLNTTEPIIISGPCSAETEAQVLQTAHDLVGTPGLRYFRAGVWKPRTRPGNFEGHGAPALPWLARVKAETGIPTAIEVANAAHVEAALLAGVDLLWVGARTTVNPFSVQEIADAIGGADVPVLVKNPINPELQLWAGAVERFAKAGIKRIGAIHRGFSQFAPSEYRNPPYWHLAIEFKRTHPELPLICDPSHITGDRAMLQAVAQRALDLQMDGLMIESHPTPDQAWSDAKQQITPQRLKELLAQLITRRISAEDDEFEQAMDAYREEIDLLDSRLLAILSQRMEVVGRIGELKRDRRVTILQLRRWDALLRRRMNDAEQLGLSQEVMKDIFDAIHRLSIEKQNEIMNKGK